MSRWKTLVPFHSAAPCTIIAVTQWPTATSAVLFHSCTPALCLWVYVCHSVQVSDLKNTIHVLKLGQSSTYWKARSAWICSRNAFIALLQTTFSLVPHQCHLPFIVRISTVSASIAMCECVCVVKAVQVIIYKCSVVYSTKASSSTTRLSSNYKYSTV